MLHQILLLLHNEKLKEINRLLNKLEAKFKFYLLKLETGGFKKSNIY